MIHNNILKHGPIFRYTYLPPSHSSLLLASFEFVPSSSLSVAFQPLFSAFFSLCLSCFMTCGWSFFPTLPSGVFVFLAPSRLLLCRLLRHHQQQHHQHNIIYTTSSTLHHLHYIIKNNIINTASSKTTSPTQHHQNINEAQDLYCVAGPEVPSQI